MNIDKAIKKQKSNFVVFVFYLGFIFVFLPVALILSNKKNDIYLIYLCIIELLIVMEIYRQSLNHLMDLKYCNSRLKIKHGLIGISYSINCEKVVYVHAIGENEKMEIIIGFKGKIKKKVFKPIDNSVLRKYKEIREYQSSLSEDNKSTRISYYSFLKGGYIKYTFLDSLYKYCPNAKFSNSTINRIKDFRRML